MSAKLSLHAGQESVWLKSKRFSRVIKMAAAVFAVLYMINGTGAAAGYAKALRTADHSSVQSIAETLWVGVTWPLVLHDMMWADPLQRVESRPELNS
jgi:hypothetical protein